ncbi:hypothetical protein C8J56DRAFT_895284 [Mycena floridula]|nr:hypothetical protein C8J56DRAFT_895284 [Mycena floridula]
MDSGKCEQMYTSKTQQTIDTIPATVLDKIIKNRLKIGHPGLHVSTFFESSARANTAFINIPHPASKRMIYSTIRGSGEVTLFVCGFLDYKQTAPFERPLDSSHRVEYQKQTIRISGHGSQQFEHSIQKLNELIKEFKTQYSGPVDSEHQGNDRIEASNRFFTPRSDMGGLNSLPLGPEIDPRGILRAAAGAEYVYTEDNEVTCFRKTSDGSGKVQYVPMRLSDLRTRAVIELRISLVGIFNASMRHPRILVVLRGVVLLDERFANIQNNIRTVQIPSGFQLGRRIRFLEEGEVDFGQEEESENEEYAGSDDGGDQYQNHGQKKRRYSAEM